MIKNNIFIKSSYMVLSIICCLLILTQSYQETLFDQFEDKFFSSLAFCLSIPSHMSVICYNPPASACQVSGS